MLLFGLGLGGATCAAITGDAPPIVALGIGGFAVACLVLAAVPRPAPGAHDGVERTTTIVGGLAREALVFRGGRLRAVAIEGSGIVIRLAGFSRSLLGAEVALPLSQLRADPRRRRGRGPAGARGSLVRRDVQEQKLMQ